MVVIIKKLKENKCNKKFNDYKDCVLNNEIILKSKQIVKHMIYMLKKFTTLH